MKNEWFTRMGNNNFFNGKFPLNYTIKKANSFKNLKKLGKVIIILFLPSSKDYAPIHLAAEVSASMKAEAFSRSEIICSIHRFNNNLTQHEVGDYFSNCNISNDVLAVIVQHPIPERFKNAVNLLCESKNLDFVKGRSTTAEAASILASPFSPFNSLTAIIGGNGGKGHIGREIKHDFDIKESGSYVIEKDDDILTARNANIIISSVGLPSLIKPEHLGTNQYLLFIDIGFSPIKNKESIEFIGDFHPLSYSYAQFIVPTPGGIGPTQISLLIERLMLLTSTSFTSWTQHYLEDMLKN
ncbi:hypothetical protein [Klebsiella quasipneumoniae]|uniref:hypothetical protein n=1 Tax=Klebsiella quasipneumoniae TaxID=1463165 RepID=UPI0023E0C029|nr:hypothetical protein [Klebsiella quasipneumoniae]